MRSRAHRALGSAIAASLAGLLLVAPAAHAAPPPNDDFADAQAIAGFPASATGTTASATREAGEPVHGEPETQDESIWFEWQAPASAAVTVDTCGTFFFSDVLAVYTGDSLAGLARVGGYATNYGPVCAGHSSFGFDALAGVTYRIAVSGGPVAGGPIALSLHATPPPANDSVATPLAISGTGIVAEGTNAGSTREAGEPDHGGGPGGHSVWFSWTAPESGVAHASSCRSDFASVVAVYEGSAGAGLERLSRPTGPNPYCPGAREQSFGVTAGSTYLLALDGVTTGAAPAEVGLFFLEIDVGPGYRQNDRFDRAQPIAPHDGVVEWDNDDATREAGEPRHAGRKGGASLWYAFTPRETGPVSLDTCGSSFDTLLAVYTGDLLAALRPVAANDDSGSRCPGTGHSELSFEAVAGTTYRIALDGAGGADGRFSLRHEQTIDRTDRTPPATRILKVRYRRGHTIAEVAFHANGNPSRVRCKLDRHHPGTCDSPQVFFGLSPGRHRLAIVAIDRAGNRDPTPAVARLRIARPSQKRSR
jgi:hypothetical protein